MLAQISLNGHSTLECSSELDREDTVCEIRVGVGAPSTATYAGSQAHLIGVCVWCICGGGGGVYCVWCVCVACVWYVCLCVVYMVCVWCVWCICGGGDTVWVCMCGMYVVCVVSQCGVHVCMVCVL